MHPSFVLVLIVQCLARNGRIFLHGRDIQGASPGMGKGLDIAVTVQQSREDILEAPRRCDVQRGAPGVFPRIDEHVLG